MTALPRGATPFAKGTWFPLIADGRKTATVTCPDCGKRGTLEHHTIEDDGRVLPSIDCPNMDCAFHDWVQLEGWAPEP